MSTGGLAQFLRGKKYPEATPRLISDNAPRLVARDGKQFVRSSGMEHVRTPPLSAVERQDRALAWLPEGGGRAPEDTLDLDDARRVGIFVEEYNTKRLHSAIGYVTPHHRLAGRHVLIWEERDRKLEAARARRRRSGGIPSRLPPSRA